MLIGIISFNNSILPNQSWVLSNVLNKGQVLNGIVYYAKINGLIHHRLHFQTSSEFFHSDKCLTVLGGIPFATSANSASTTAPK